MAGAAFWPLASIYWNAGAGKKLLKEGWFISAIPAEFNHLRRICSWMWHKGFGLRTFAGLWLGGTACSRNMPVA